MATRARAAAIVLAMALCTACATEQPRQAGFRFVPKACPPELATSRVRCGSVAVPENYADRSGRSIALNVIVFEAGDQRGERGAQFDLDGGPGLAVTDSAGFYAGDGAIYRAHRDVVLADMRGTGGSGGLFCPGLAQADPRAPMYPPDLVRSCAATLSARTDLRQYGTAPAARDIDAVREALGYRRIDLNALSYGTTLALRYIADHPGRVRTAVLTGTVPAGRMPPRYHAQSAEHGLELLFKACASEPACARRYPDPASDLALALARLEPGVRPIFLEKLRTLMYSAATSRRVPAVLRAAAAGDTGILDRGAEGGRSFADGLYLSVTCSESVAMMDMDMAIAAAARTRFGAYRLQRQRDACRQWPVAAPDPHLLDAPRSGVPVLFISGAMDPVTPPDWAAETAARFPSSRHVVVAEGAHVLDGLSGMDTCLDRVVPQFVEQGSAAGIDMDCFASMRAGPFP